MSDNSNHVETVNIDPSDIIDANAPAADDAPGLSEQAQQTEARPGWLPAKFESPEALAKAYDELSKKLGGAQTQQPAGLPRIGVQTPAGTPAPVIPPTPTGQVTPVQAGINKAMQEFQATGDVGEATTKELEALGINRDMIEQYKVGGKYQVEQFEKAVIGVAGSPEQFQAMTEWARDNLQPGEIAEFNKAIDSRDTGRASLATRGLFYQFQQATGGSPQLIKGTAERGMPAAATFKDQKEVTDAMSDPRYQTSESYRNSVKERLRNASF